MAAWARWLLGSLSCKHPVFLHSVKALRGQPWAGHSGPLARPAWEGNSAAVNEVPLVFKTTGHPETSSSGRRDPVTWGQGKECWERRCPRREGLGYPPQERAWLPSDWGEPCALRACMDWAAALICFLQFLFKKMHPWWLVKNHLTKAGEAGLTPVAGRPYMLQSN